MSRGSTANVIAALASFFIPGLGQLIQGRLLAALVVLLIAGLFWLPGLITFGLLSPFGIIGHIIAAFEAAVWKSRA